MKALFATKKTQGQRKSDFSFAQEGELVYPSWVCDRDARSSNPDNGCGCGRCLSGLVSHKGTTTSVIGEFNGDLAVEIKKSLIAGGWGEELGAKHGPLLAAQIIELCDKHPVGTIVERRGENVLVVREVKL